MSHNTVKVAGEAADIGGQHTLNLTDLGGFASSVAGAYLGCDGSGNPKIVSLPTGEGLTMAYWAAINYSGWGGNAFYSVGYDLPWRRSSADEYINASYATISSGTWVDALTLVAGTYIIIASHPAESSAAGDTLNVRLYNATAAAYIGPEFQKGGGRGSDLFFTVATLASSSSIQWRVTAMSGTWELPSASTHRGCRILAISI